MCMSHVYVYFFDTSFIGHNDNIHKKYIMVVIVMAVITSLIFFWFDGGRLIKT